jgi:tetratricopeptide (TPR) repeat protein
VLNVTDEDGERVELQRAKIVLLVLLEEFKDALETFKEFSISPNELQFERAYSLYRMSRYEAALNIIIEAGANPEDGRLTTLKAQVLYRMNRPEEAVAIYKDLAHDEEESDNERVIVNYLAAQAATGINDTDLPMMSDESHEDFSKLADTSSEAQFNYSCYLANHGEYKDALEVLRTSIQWATEAYRAEGLIGGVAEGELRQCQLQGAFLLFKLGRVNEARSMLKGVALGNDVPSMLASFNLGVLDGNSDGVQKILEEGRLSMMQRHYGMLDLALAMRKGGKLKSAARILRKLVKVSTLKALAIAILVDVLTEMQANSEIMVQSGSCRIFQLAVELRKMRDYPDYRLSGDNVLFKYAGIIGAVSDDERVAKLLSASSLPQLAVPKAFSQWTSGEMSIKQVASTFSKNDNHHEREESSSSSLVIEALAQ